MKKKFLLFGALVGALLLSSCSGGSKKQTVSSESTEELDDASNDQLLSYVARCIEACG